MARKDADGQVCPGRSWTLITSPTGAQRGDQPGLAGGL